jgi:PKD repeat protein
MLFSARYSDDPDGDDMTYSWTFGDGAEGSGRFTNHTYQFIGTYAASLMVSDGEKIDIDSFIVTIIERPVNHPPTAKIHVAKTTIYKGEDLTFDGRTSTDPDFDKLVYDWDFDATDGVDDWVRGAAVVRSWDATGAYVVTLMVSDGYETSTDSLTITVTTPPPPNVNPRAKAGPDIVTKVGKRVQLNGEGIDTDGHIVSWEWDLDGDGEFDTYSERDGTVSQSFDTPGIYTLRLRVTDNRGAISTDSIIVTVEKAGNGADDSPGLSVLLTLVALTLIAIPLKTRSATGAGGGIRGEKGGPSFKYGQ